MLVGQRRAARGLDLGGHGGRHRAIGPDALHGAPEVVDDDAGTTAGQQERVGAADAAARARDDRDASLETVLVHARPRPLSLLPAARAV